MSGNIHLNPLWILAGRILTTTRARLNQTGTGCWLKVWPSTPQVRQRERARTPQKINFSFFRFRLPPHPPQAMLNMIEAVRGKTHDIEYLS